MAELDVATVKVTVAACAMRAAAGTVPVGDAAGANPSPSTTAAVRGWPA